MRLFSRCAVNLAVATGIALAPCGFTIAHAETLALDADYAGYAEFLPGRPTPASVTYTTQGVSALPAAGLSNISLGAECDMDFFTGSRHLVQHDWGRIDIYSSLDTRLWGHLIHGDGTPEDWMGEFLVEHGGGPYEGFTGGGAFRVVTSSPVSFGAHAPAVISIRGSVSRPASAVPEPGSLMLLFVGAIPLGARTARKRVS